MTLEQIVIFGGMALTGALGIIAFFLRRILWDHDKVKMEVSSLDARMADMRLAMEGKFVSGEVFEVMRTEFRTSLKEIYQEQGKVSSLLARLDERSQWEERFSKIMERLGPKGRR